MFWAREESGVMINNVTGNQLLVDTTRNDEKTAITHSHGERARVAMNSMLQQCNV